VYGFQRLTLPTRRSAQLLLGGQKCGLVNTRMEEESPYHLHTFYFAPAPARVGVL
jgi:hypothetical protein